MNDIEKTFSQHDLDIHGTHHFSALKTFDYDQITEEIFVGTNMCCIVGYARELLEKNVLADISLEKERIDNPIGIDYFLWLPTANETAPTPKQTELGVKVIDFFVKNKIKLYAHCQNGHGRAPTLVAAYLLTQGMKVSEAIELLKKKRPAVHPNEVQMKALEDFQNKLVKV